VTFAPFANPTTTQTPAFGQNLNTPLNKILINTLGTGVALVNGILPWATVAPLAPVNVGAFPSPGSQYDFATFAAAGTASSIAAFTNYKTSLIAAGPTDTVRLTASETLTGNKVVNAILFAGTSTGADVTITQNNFTLGVASGAILSMGNQTL